MAIVVHVREKNTRFIDVCHEESIGIAKSEAIGRVMGARREESDIVREYLLDKKNYINRRRDIAYTT